MRWHGSSRHWQTLPFGVRRLSMGGDLCSLCGGTIHLISSLGLRCSAIWGSWRMVNRWTTNRSGCKVEALARLSRQVNQLCNMEVDRAAACMLVQCVGDRPNFTRNYVLQMFAWERQARRRLPFLPRCQPQPKKSASFSPPTHTTWIITPNFAICLCDWRRGILRTKTLGLPNMDPSPEVLHRVTGNLRHSREGSSCSTGEFPILRVQVHHLERQLSIICGGSALCFVLRVLLGTSAVKTVKKQKCSFSIAF